MTFWDEHATPSGVFNPPPELYDSMTLRQVDYILNQLGNVNTILDFGCGIGRLMTRIWEQSPNVYIYGIDGSLNMLNRVESKGPGLLYLADSQVPPKLGRVVDGAFAVLVMQHMPDQTCRDVVWDICRELRPGGRFVSQWVIGDPASSHELSYKRWLTDVLGWLKQAGFGTLIVDPDSVVTDYSGEWVWVTATKEGT